MCAVWHAAMHMQMQEKKYITTTKQQSPQQNENLLAFAKDACNADAVFFSPCLQSGMLAVCAVPAIHLQHTIHACMYVRVCVRLFKASSSPICCHYCRVIKDY